MKDLMKAIKTIIACAAVIFAAACARETVPSTSITVSIDNNSRTVIGELTGNTRHLYWADGDRIAVGGLVSEPLSNVGEKVSTATFNFASAPVKPYKVIYPASSYVSDNTVNLPLRCETIPMGGQGTRINALTAILKISVVKGSKDATLRRIEVKAQDNRQMSGNFTIDYAAGTLSQTDPSSDNAKVYVPADGALSETALEYFIAVPAGNYGFTVKLIDAGGNYMEKASSKVHNLVAGTITALETLAFEPAGQTELDIEISSAEQLVKFAQDVNSGAVKPSATAILTADIDMAGVTQWTPIGNPETVTNANTACSYTGPAFKGVFDGNGKCIYNFNVDVTVPANGTWGLFGVLDGATVKNLTLGRESDESGVSIGAAAQADAAVLAGTVFNGSSILNCRNYIPLNVKGTATNSNRFACGVFAGFVCSTDKSTSLAELVNCAPVTMASGSNTANGATGVSIGGIAGFCTGSGSETTIIENCENKGNLTGACGRSSGIAATMNAKTMMRYCVNRGNNVNSFANGRVGNLTCIMGTGCSMDDCTNYGDVITSDAQTTTAGMVALLNNANVVVTGGGNYGKVIGAYEKYHGLLCANFSTFSKVDGCYAGGECYTYSPDGKHVKHEITKDNLASHLGYCSDAYRPKITNISSPYGSVEGGGDDDPTDVIKLKDASLRILFLGNSFTMDAVQHLPALLAGSGINGDITLAHCYYGGRTVTEYNDWTKADYTLYKAEAGASTWTTHSAKVSIAQVANGGRWDIVTIQEHTGNYHGWIWNDAEKADLESLIEKVAKTQSVKPKFYYIFSQSYFNMGKIGSGSRSYMTWPLDSEKSSQLAMYQVCKARAEKVMANCPFDGVIATGTMLQNLRTTAINNNGWDLTRDGYHMDNGIARYGAACTVFEKLVAPSTGKNLDDNTFRYPTFNTAEGSVSTPVTDVTAPVAIKAARYAVQKPFEITDMSDEEIPGYSGEGPEDIKLKGSGTQADPYLLEKAGDMPGISAKLSAGAEVWFKMTTDIDMASLTNWEPVSLTGDGRKIHFDGGNHTISNFTCNGKTYASLLGIFCGSIRDVTFDKCSVTNSGVCAIVAGQAGTASASATVTNVNVTRGYVYQNGTSTRTECAGLCAQSSNATYTYCSFEGELKNNCNGRTGGIVGAVLGDVTVEKCHTNLQLYIAKANSGDGVGGVVGGPTADKKLTVRNCYSEGAYTGPGGYLGGVVGELASNGTVENCYSTMTIVGDYAMGGVTGRIVNVCNPNSSGKWQSDFNNTVSGCIAWMNSITTNRAGGRTPATGYSSGAVVAFTVYKNTLKNCWRKPGMTLNVYDSAHSALNTTFDQEDCDASHPYVKPGTDTYYMPYHGKAASSGETLTDVAKRIGWSAEIWDFSADKPTLRQE